MDTKKHSDRTLLLLLALLVVGGALIFASAALGLLARGSTGMSSVVFSHLVLGVGAGIVLLTISAHVDYRKWRPYVIYFFLFALFLTALVFEPHIGLSHGGGSRWLRVWRFSLQPSELLKISGILVAAAYFATIKAKTATTRYGLGGLAAILAGPAVLLILQPDLGTLGIVTLGVCSVFFAAGARLRDIIILLLSFVLALAMLAYMRPYVRDRVMTFINPTAGQQVESYQIRQSLIAIGSGGLLGRGLGQGVQKFTYLPEPMGDSIFAVAGEELGFAGATCLILLFLGVALRGFLIAARTTDHFGALLAVGISSYLVGEAFINIAAMLGVAPLTGIPLTFVSQGGTAMLVSLASAGILLSISKFKRS